MRDDFHDYRVDCMRRLGRSRGLSSLVMIGFSFFVSCSGTKPESEQDTQTLRGQGSNTEVRVATVRKGPFTYTIETSGKVESSVDVSVQAQSPGVIWELYVANGEQVAKGSLIAKISDDRQRLSLQKAKLLLAEKELAFQDQIMNYQSKGDSAKYKQAIENIRTSSGLASAQLSVQEAELDLARTTIRATVSGVVSNLSIVTGSAVTAGQPILSIYDPAQLRVSCVVIETDAIRIRKGNKGQIRTLDGQHFLPVVVSEINPRVDEKSNQSKVWLRLNQSSQVWPGMTVAVSIDLPERSTLLVPKEALVLRSGREVVFVAEGGMAKWNYVKTGRENGTDIEVIEGLQEGQQVIVTNNLQLAHETPITIASQ